MSVNAVVNPALGTVLRLGSGTAGNLVYNPVAQVLSIDGPSRKVGTRDTTNLSSTARTYAPTIFEGGQVSGDIQYDPQSTSHLALEALLTPPLALANWQMLFPDTTNGTTTYTFQGVLEEFGPTGEAIESNLIAKFSIKVSGVITVEKGI